MGQGALRPLRQNALARQPDRSRDVLAGISFAKVSTSWNPLLGSILAAADTDDTRADGRRGAGQRWQNGESTLSHPVQQ